MYRCILAPVDGTAFGEHALSYAAGIARRSGGTLHLLHVHEPAVAPLGVDTAVFRGAWTEVAKEQEIGYLEGLAERLRAEYGVRVETLVREGPVAEEVERCAQERRASLVVMSTRGHTGLSRLWHHGVAEQVARGLPIPTLLVRPAQEGDPELGARREVRHILIPLDGTPPSETILQHAVTLGRTFGARYTLMRVIRPDPRGHSMLRQDGHHAHHQLVRDQMIARQYLSALAEQFRAGGLEADTHLAVAREPGSAILDLVRAAQQTDHPYDLIAMECHPHGAVARLVTTHTGDVVLRGSPVPVLFLQAPAVPLAAAETSPLPARS